MLASQVVEPFEVRNRFVVSSLTRLEGSVPDLGLETVEEALQDRIVITISDAGHAAAKPQLSQPILVSLRGVLLGFKESSQRCLGEQSVQADRRLRQGFSSRGSCGVGR